MILTNGAWRKKFPEKPRVVTLMQNVHKLNVENPSASVMACCTLDKTLSGRVALNVHKLVAKSPRKT